MPFFLLLTLLATIAGETGTLRIHSQPYAEVVWEGVALGRTDTDGVLTVSDIPPGTFRLAVRKTGFSEFQTTVTVAGGQMSFLEAELRPPPPIKTPKGKPAGPGKRAEPVSSGHENLLNELLKSKPTQGPLPVWPAASRPAPEASANGIPVWPFVLGGAVIVLVFWLSRKMKPAALSRSPALLDDSDLLQRAHTPEKAAAFLSDLKKREELLERGVEIVPDRAKGSVIDLDSQSVREVEEQ